MNTSKFVLTEQNQVLEEISRIIIIFSENLPMFRWVEENAISSFYHLH